MAKPTIYLNLRIRKEVIKNLRKYERNHKLRSSVSSTIEHLLAVAQQLETNKQASFNWSGPAGTLTAKPYDYHLSGPAS